MSTEDQNTFMFEKENYILIIAGFVIVLLGFITMTGGEAATLSEYNPEVFSTQRITIAPLMCLFGFGIVGWGIMKKPKKQE